MRPMRNPARQVEREAAVPRGREGCGRTRKELTSDEGGDRARRARLGARPSRDIEVDATGSERITPDNGHRTRGWSATSSTRGRSPLQ